MKLPHAERAFVDREKLTDYLLSLGHPIGGPKAVFFHALGFDESNPEELEKEFLRMAREEDVVSETPGPHGVKYAMDGDIKSPSGRAARVRTVWIIETGRDAPRLVTAHPN